MQSLVFPRSLRKLSLENYHIPWEHLNTIGLSLPHLQVIRLSGAILGLCRESIPLSHKVNGGKLRLLLSARETSSLKFA
ncbi:hypothetical protein ACS0TY_015413 [Phlomoides rotata]